MPAYLYKPIAGRNWDKLPIESLNGERNPERIITFDSDVEYLYTTTTPSAWKA